MWSLTLVMAYAVILDLNKRKRMQSLDYVKFILKMTLFSKINPISHLKRFR